MTIAIAMPVLRAPSARVFGAEIVGRHHDPFTVMRQFADGSPRGVYFQPVTDVAGAAMARGVGAVAAYNGLVLLSFPLSAAAAYLLARHLALPAVAALVAALLFAFSPFHLAHAAYHPHVAQMQWLPLYLLALWRCLHNATWGAIAFLIVATVAVTLSNFYGGLIAAVVTPIAVGGGWFARPRLAPFASRHLAVTAATLMGLALAGVAFAGWRAPGMVGGHGGYAFARAELFQYSATWWAYLVPPVSHPLLGVFAQRTWIAAGVHDGLLEQQVGLGWSVMALGSIAVVGWIAARAAGPRGGGEGDRRVPMLAALGIVAFVCSLSPEGTVLGVAVARPSAWLYQVVPMFRSYARFGGVVQLAAVLLAGIGLERLWRNGTRRARVACFALGTLAAAEYAVSPAALSRDVLPTRAHRWAMAQADPVRVLDCTPLDEESESVQWLTAGRVTLLGGSIRDCADPDLSRVLAANGYTHLLVRTPVGRSPADPFATGGWPVAARFDDGRVYAVTAGRRAIYTAAMAGFFPRERDGEWSWRWMGAAAAWTVVNASDRPIVAALAVELSAFRVARELEVRLDGRRVQSLVVAPSRRTYVIGPLTVRGGEHELTFRPFEAATETREGTDRADSRPLSFALGSWRWTLEGEPQ